jgi:hypothetical protein
MEFSAVNIITAIFTIPLTWVFIGIHGYLIAKYVGLTELYGVPNTFMNACGRNGGMILMSKVLLGCPEYMDKVNAEADGDLRKSDTFSKGCNVTAGIAIFGIMLCLLSLIY